jgi:hypothetical protein
VHLYATPEPDSVFLGWGGACSGSEPFCDVTITDAHLAVALFDGPRQLTLVVDGADGAEGIVDAVVAGWPGISCACPGAVPGPVVCEGVYPLGASAQVYANPGPRSVFLGWGGDCGGAEPGCVVTIDSAKTVTATFGAAAQPVVWTNRVGVSESSGVLTKTAVSGWGNAGAASTQLLMSGAGSVTFTATETTTQRMLGLGGGGDSSQSYGDVDHAIHLSAGGALQVFEKGIVRGSFGPYSPGDLLQVTVVPGATPRVQYLRNGVVFYTSPVVPVYPLMVDCALYTTGATLAGAVVSGGWQTPQPPAGQTVEWTNAAGVTVSAGSLTKTAATGWGNAGASSVQRLVSGEGSVTFTASETTKNRMAGLGGGGDDTRSYADLDYAIYLSSDGRVRVYEAGQYRGTFGSYASGDWLQVAVVSEPTPRVRYSRNGLVFYTSNVAPAYPLMVDSALHTNGATVTDALVSGSWE